MKTLKDIVSDWLISNKTILCCAVSGLEFKKKKQEFEENSLVTPPTITLGQNTFTLPILSIISKSSFGEYVGKLIKTLFSY